MNVGIIGFGAIGRQRYDALVNLKKMGYPIDKIFIYDTFETKDNSYLWVDDLEDIKKKNLGLVIIATPHDITPNIIREFIPTGIKILAEKPFCSSHKEALDIFNSLQYKNQLYVGFNYRFFDGIENIFEDLRKDVFGTVYGVNIELGHGQSPKDKASWKNEPNRVMGGCTYDPGIHALDLLYFMDNDITVNVFAEIKEDGLGRESTAILVSEKFGIVNMQTSLVRWKNIFKFQINGKKYCGTVTGRGGNYGTQKYTKYKKWAWLDGESENLMLETDCKNSFTKELESILFGKEYFLPPCTAEEALGSMMLYEKCLELLDDSN